MTFHFRHVLLVALLVCWTGFVRPAHGSPDLSDALTQWKEAVESGKIGDIMGMYERNAIMISTFAQNPLTKRSEIENYYKKVVSNTGIMVKIEDTHPQVFGDIGVISGRYTLSYVQEGETIAIPARFTFVYRLLGGKWMIVDQHSSRVPLSDEDK